MDVVQTVELTYQQRLDALRETKLRHTKEKQEIIGAMNYDDWAVILPPPEVREVTKAISGSGVEITDVLIKGVKIESNYPSGGWFGPEIVGKNYRALLEAHPVYIDPMSSLAGAYMVTLALTARSVGLRSFVTRAMRNIGAISRAHRWAVNNIFART